MRTADRWVVDSSVAGKWYLADEDMAEHANALLERWQTGSLSFVAPHLARHEVCSLLTNACRAGRIGWDRAHAELENFVATRITAVEDPSWLLQTAMDISREYPLSLYDALYVGMARETGANLVTADQRMYRGLAGRLPFVVWLGDIPL
jgi:predicted nucleic acid-binding protein